MAFWLIFSAYLLGSIPFGLIIARFQRIDIRAHGSGNIGATNVFRTLGPLPGAAAFILDFLKGLLAVNLGFWAGGEPWLVISFGAAAVLGHMFPVFLGFKGGKGAATGSGVLAGIAPDIFAAAAVLAAVLIYTTRYVSVASMATAAAAAVLMIILAKPLPYIITTLGIAAFIFLRHLPNLRRLMNGTEPRV